MADIDFGWVKDMKEPDRVIGWRTITNTIWYKTKSGSDSALDHKAKDNIMIYQDESGMKMEGGISNAVFQGSIITANCPIGNFNVKARGVDQDDSNDLRKHLKMMHCTF